MKRSCKKLPLERFIKDNADSLHGIKANVSLYIDDKEEKDVIKLIQNKKNQKRWRIILIHILKNEYNDLVYRKEPNGLTAMKFSTTNSRIYCKEYRDISGTKIVMSFLYMNKDFDKASNKKIKSKLESISNYEYF